MSGENAKLFFEKVEKDSELKLLLAKRIIAHQIESRKALSDIIVGLGKEAGFEFTAADLAKNGAGVSGELSAAELERVAGGGDTGMTNAELLKMQQLMSNYSNYVSMTSNIQKKLSEMIKSIMGNLRVF